MHVFKAVPLPSERRCKGRGQLAQGPGAAKAATGAALPGHRLREPSEDQARSTYLVETAGQPQANAFNFLKSILVFKNLL